MLNMSRRPNPWHRHALVVLGKKFVRTATKNIRFHRLLIRTETIWLMNATDVNWFSLRMNWFKLSLPINCSMKSFNPIDNSKRFVSDMPLENRSSSRLITQARFGKLHRAAYRIINDTNNLQETRKKAVVDKIVGNIFKTLVNRSFVLGAHRSDLFQGDTLSKLVRLLNDYDQKQQMLDICLSNKLDRLHIQYLTNDVTDETKGISSFTTWLHCETMTGISARKLDPNLWSPEWIDRKQWTRTDEYDGSTDLFEINCWTRFDVGLVQTSDCQVRELLFLPYTELHWRFSSLVINMWSPPVRKLCCRYAFVWSINTTRTRNELIDGILNKESFFQSLSVSISIE